MRNNSWVALIIVFGIIAFAVMSTANVSFTTFDAPNGTDPEATTGDTLIFVEGAGITITGDATTDEITIASTGGVTLVDDPGGTTFTSDSESGMEIVSTELSLLRGCTNGQVLKWDSTTEDWNCSADSTGGSPTFDAIASGTNTTATMTVGSGASVAVTGLGHVESTQTLNGIHNDSGATLFECTAVFISSFDIPSNLPEALIADADATEAAMGIVHTDIANGANGFAVVNGSIAGVDTTNVESWAVGDVLYLNTAGVSTDTECGNTLTNIRPTGAGTGIVKMALVERVHATDGKLKVISNAGYDEAPNLADDNVLIGSATDVASTEAIPDCNTNNVDRLQYDTATNAFACDSDTFDTNDITDSTIQFQDINHFITTAGNPTLGVNDQFFGGAGIIFEGPGNDTFEGELSSTVAGSDKSWVLPNVSGDIVTTGDTGTVDSTMILDNAINFPDIDYTNTMVGDLALGNGEVFFGGGGIIFENSVDAIEGAIITPDGLTVTDKSWLLPDADGYFVLDATSVTDVEGRSLTIGGTTLNADVELYTDTHTLWIENPTAADDFQTIWTTPSINYTITAITCESDQTVTFDLQIDDGTPAAVNGSDIVCTTYATDSSLAGDVGLDAGERLDLAITSVTGTPTFVSISWTVTKND